jgi:hypothetical protein
MRLSLALPALKPHFRGPRGLRGPHFRGLRLVVLHEPNLQSLSCESFGETEEESRKETDQAAEQEEKRKGE